MGGETMKQLIAGILCICLWGTDAAFSQFKQRGEQAPPVSGSFIKPQDQTDWFSFFNPNNFQMRHSYSMSYSTIGGRGMALQQYTNTMTYAFSSNLDARVDISMQNSPYNTFESRLQNQFNKVFISSAELNYRPWENTTIKLSYRELPFNYMMSGYSPYYNGIFSGVDFYEGDR
jgi:hypothetical protein